MKDVTLEEEKNFKLSEIIQASSACPSDLSKMTITLKLLKFEIKGKGF